MRALAKAALMNYGIADATFSLVRQAGNTLFPRHDLRPAESKRP